MTRILAVVALAAALPFAAFAQGETAQLRESVAASGVVQAAKVDVSMLSDEQVGQLHAILSDGDASDEEKQKRVMEISGTN